MTENSNQPHERDPGAPEALIEGAAQFAGRQTTDCRSPEWWYEHAAGFVDSIADSEAALEHARSCARCQIEQTLALEFVQVQATHTNEAPAKATNTDDPPQKPPLEFRPAPPTPLADQSNTSTTNRWQWLAAAAVVVALFGSYSLVNLGSASTPEVRPPGADATVRSRSIQFTQAFDRLAQAPETIEWSAVETEHYLVQIKRVDGQVLLERHTETPRLQLTEEEQQRLRPYVSYSMSVAATAVDGTVLRSPPTQLRIETRPKN